MDDWLQKVRSSYLGRLVLRNWIPSVLTTVVVAAVGGTAPIWLPDGNDEPKTFRLSVGATPTETVETLVVTPDQSERRYAQGDDVRIEVLPKEGWTHAG